MGASYRAGGKVSLNRWVTRSRIWGPGGASHGTLWENSTAASMTNMCKGVFEKQPGPVSRAEGVRERIDREVAGAREGRTS